MCDSPREGGSMTDPVREAIRLTLKSNPANLKAAEIALRMGVNQSSLYRWGESADQDIPLNRLLQLTHISQDPRTVAAVCKLAGGIFVLLKAGASTKEAATEATVKAVKEFSDLLQEVSKDLFDGTISQEELVRIRREAAQAQQAIAQLLDVIEAIAEKRP